jgi:hypothetical protein
MYCGKTTKIRKNKHITKIIRILYSMDIMLQRQCQYSFNTIKYNCKKRHRGGGGQKKRTSSISLEFYFVGAEL